ncbi:fructosamine kinase family protein [Alteribacter natronophilus]|uniref:fructosamine kinase family protein n=1 Tax=Alteribacter natronophilus TaxID=2583810 RepID=UPI00110E284C|nr:fructosamine kinase family protein [Alteribacter natronophilus]TMW73504.1 fructosamine kinase family protein [Alteribacter natronophilus]
MSRNSELIQLAQKVGVGSADLSFTPVSGGDINEAYCLEGGSGTWFMKINRQIPPDFFELEAESLRKLEEAGGNVPSIKGTAYHNGVGTIVLHWINTSSSERGGEKLGEMLARVHKPAESAFYGYEGKTYIGTLAMENGWWPSWTDFYREKRLIHQLEIGKRKGTITGRRLSRLENLIERLDTWIPPEPGVSLLHGDLWGGNWISGKGGEAWLIDPSVFYGHREMDLAFTRLFGGFPASFYESYEYYYPLDRDFSERERLYQLFYLLVHLNFFGEAYGTSVDRIFDYYLS